MYGGVHFLFRLGQLGGGSEVCRNICVILRLVGEFMKKSIFLSSLFFHQSIVNFQHDIKTRLVLKEGELEVAFYSS